MRLINNIFIFLFVFNLLDVYAQKEASIWYFGDSIGLKFTIDKVIPINDCKLFSREGSASISDSKGNLLFYTNGEKAFNRKHQIMSNGMGLKGNISSTQSSIIVPKPGSDSIYFLITIDAHESQPSKGAYYSEINMSLDNGLGAITSIKNFPLQSKTDEKVAIVRHSNQLYYWILIPETGTSFINSYLLTENGISNKVIKNDINFMIYGGQGYLKVSLLGNKITSSFSRANKILIADFDNATGQIKNSIQLPLVFPWGVEFSPNGKFLYARNNEVLLQFDLSNFDSNSIVNSAYEVYRIYGPDKYPGGLQMAIDNKIYYNHSYTRSIAVIEKPNQLREKCNFISNYITLERKCEAGLPAFINTLFIPRSYEFKSEVKVYNCSNIVHFYFTDTLGIINYHWDFGDIKSGADNYSTNIEPTHFYESDGIYKVRFIIEHIDHSFDTIWQSITIKELSNKFNMPDRITECGQSFKLDYYQEKATYLWESGSKDSYLEVTENGIYKLTLIDSNNCVFVDSSYVILKKNDVVFIPNSFSPNNDGINDFLKIDATNACNYTIYDRWGGVVTTNNNCEQGWDGTLNGIECQEGIYLFCLSTNNCNNDLVNYRELIHLVR